MKSIALYLIFLLLGIFVATFSSIPSTEKKVFSKDCSGSTLDTFKSSSSLPDVNLISVPNSNLKPLCKIETTLKFIKQSYRYDDTVLDKVTLLSRQIKEEVEKKPETEEEIKYEHNRIRNLNEATESFKKRYPRFPIQNNTQDDQNYYGIHTGDYTDAKRFLGERVCANPRLMIANGDTSYLSLFFSLNNGRDYGGIVRVINERIVTLIEGSFSFNNTDEYFKWKRAPRATFTSWIHEDIERDYKGWVYQNQSIGQTRYPFESPLSFSPWLYNSCNKSIGVVSNFCSLDPSYDMEFKEFFYLTNYDVMLGNIYCKKSSDKGWTRLALVEFIRI